MCKVTIIYINFKDMIHVEVYFIPFFAIIAMNILYSNIYDAFYVRALTCHICVITCTNQRTTLHANMLIDKKEVSITFMAH